MPFSRNPENHLPAQNSLTQRLKTYVHRLAIGAMLTGVPGCVTSGEQEPRSAETEPSTSGRVDCKTKNPKYADIKGIKLASEELGVSLLAFQQEWEFEIERSGDNCEMVYRKKGESKPGTEAAAEKPAENHIRFDIKNPKYAHIKGIKLASEQLGVSLLEFQQNYEFEAVGDKPVEFRFWKKGEAKPDFEGKGEEERHEEVRASQPGPKPERQSERLGKLERELGDDIADAHAYLDALKKAYAQPSPVDEGARKLAEKRREARLAASRAKAEKKRYEPTLKKYLEARADYLTADEAEMIYWMNQARMTPGFFARSFLNPQSHTPEEQELYEEMMNMDIWHTNPFISSEAVSKAAEIWSRHAGNQGIIGHEKTDAMASRFERAGVKLEGNAWAENLAYGEMDPLQTVIGFLIDEGVGDRGHRKTILDPKYRCVGISNHAHDSEFKRISVHNFSAQCDELKSTTKIASIYERPNRFEAFRKANKRMANVEAREQESKREWIVEDFSLSEAARTRLKDQLAKKGYPDNIDVELRAKEDETSLKLSLTLGDESPIVVLMGNGQKQEAFEAVLAKIKPYEPKEG